MLEKRIPPLALVLIIGLLMWVIANWSPRIETSEALRLSLAAILLALGTLFPLAGVMSFRSAQTTVDPRTPEASSKLVSSGVYRFSRNPMYVGFALWLLATAWALVGVIFFVVYMNRFQIEPEERALRDLFGEDFREYERRVRRWI